MRPHNNERQWALRLGAHISECSNTTRGEGAGLYAVGKEVQSNSNGLDTVLSPDRLSSTGERSLALISKSGRQGGSSFPVLDLEGISAKANSAAQVP